jgi:hypothetical protein
MAPATAQFARRVASLPPCDPARNGFVQGVCETSLEVPGGRLALRLQGDMKLNEDGSLHLERGEATVWNLQPSRSLTVSDGLGRTYRIPPMGKADVSDEPLQGPPTPAQGGPVASTEQPPSAPPEGNADAPAEAPSAPVPPDGTPEESEP